MSLLEVPILPPIQHFLTLARMVVARMVLFTENDSFQNSFQSSAQLVLKKLVDVQWTALSYSDCSVGLRSLANPSSMIA